ncbi:intradiol ring-cleavage dioxygenase [Terrabacter sp. MAHUQ-38]|jgi:protocatechuate 3,4-dioxygenase beta subunit|uniref:intradiol ring-cleavage dioxygenase n=1 Tax=unclassified Terrabacter TaxID=2630222 RepID=UPI00165D98D6|nr:intradiol ring-cleavage dioxygenase [Terrabacter sp. MAHUQ-38]MBC9823229.1 intradiol ring-cleavage dioxygenase [Terrabacter sp. MAHUQ-38]
MAPSTSEREWLDENGNEIEDHDRGLVFDIQTLVDRRRALILFGGLGVAGALAACSSGSPATTGSTSTAAASSATTTAATSATSTTSAAADGNLVEAPDETAGPYPGDGSNGQNALDDSGIVRQDIRSSFGTSTTTAEGVPLTIKLTVKDLSSSSALVGAAVYAWHCDREGRYSMYSQGVEDENYLRGVQATDESGTATFSSIFPACYAGRWPHIHFEVYEKVADATSSGPIVKTSQIALPRAACETVYATSGYEQSVGNLSQVSLERDNVFGDDAGVHQLATMSGSVSSGYTAALTIGV